MEGSPKIWMYLLPLTSCILSEQSSEPLNQRLCGQDLQRDPSLSRGNRTKPEQQPEVAAIQLAGTIQNSNLAISMEGITRWDLAASTLNGLK